MKFSKKALRPIDPDVFERVQRLLHARTPKIVVARVTMDQPADGLGNP
jgi:hypothetical protein